MDGAAESGWRARVEEAFERWGRGMVRHPWLALLASLGVTFWLASYLPQLTIDNSTEAFLLPDDPAVIAYNAARDEFGRDDRILVAVASPQVFSLDFLERLRALHRAIEREVPSVSAVDSLLNARVTEGRAGGLVVGELLEDWPETTADLRRLEARVRSNPLYENTLLSADGRLAVLTIEPETYSASGQPDLDGLGGFDDASDMQGAGDEAPVFLTAPEISALMESLRAVLARFEAEDFRISVAGALPMTHRIDIGMQRDLGLMLPAAVLLMSLVLALLFRRVGGVVLPQLVVLLSMVATLGVMILLGIPGSTAVQILPVFLLTVGVCDAVHILALVYRFRMEGVEKNEAIARALGHSGLAILMTSLTTAAGMASFVTAEMAAIRHLGILAPIGVVMAFVYTAVLLPASMAIFPLPAPRRGRMARGLFPFESFLVKAGSFAARHPVRILVPTSGLVVLLLLGALQIGFSHNGLEWFPEDDRVRRDFAVVNDELRGAVTLDVLIDAGQRGGLYEPEVLQAIERFSERVVFLPAQPLFIGKTLSLIDILKETHQALHEDRPEMRRIPDERALVAQELLLFEQSGSDDTEEFVDSGYRRARISMRIPFADALLYGPLLRDIEALAEQELGPHVDYELSGLMTLLARIFEQLIGSMLRSYSFALLVITPMMMLLVGSLRRGAVAMVPNLLPVLAVLGACGWMGVRLDSTTMMVGAMVIGIAVDDTIHFMHKFQRYFEQTGDVEAAIRETLRTTGSALLFTTLVLIAGFGVFQFAEMSNMRIFGALAAMATGVALLADLLVAPALLTLVEAAREPRASLPGTAPVAPGQGPDPV